MADSVAEQIAALRDDDWAVREDAATVLGLARDARAVRPLIATLKDPDKAVRDAAVRALIAIGEASVEPLVDCLTDSNPTVQEAAASILAAIGDGRVIEALIGVLASPNWIVRMHAVKGLGRIGDPRAVEPLIPLLQDKVKAVREDTAAALAHIGRAAVPVLVAALAHSEWLVRLHAVEALGRIKAPEAVEPLLSVLFNDPDASIREDAARSLGDIGDARAVEFLLVAIETEGIRSRAIEALGKIRDRRAVPALTAVVAGTAKPANSRPLQGCGDRYDEEMFAREAAVKALAQIGDASVIPILVEALQHTVIRAEAAAALSAFGQASIAPLLDVLKRERDANIVYHVRETLAQVGWRAGRL